MAHEAVSPDIVYPLAFSDSGDPAPVPDGAKFFRMKVYRGASKRPEIVRTEAGIPRLIPLTTTPDEFRRMVGPGRYRLEPVYKNGYTIENAEAAVVVIEESMVEESHGDSVSEQLVNRVLNENRLLIDRMFEYAERQSEQQARLLAEAAEKSQRLITTMAERFGNYLTGSAKLLRAAHPAIDSQARTPVEVIAEAEAVRNAVDGLADGEGADDRVLSLVEKTIEGGMPIVRQLVHRWVLGLSEEQAKALTGEVPTVTAEADAAATSASAGTGDFVGHLNAIQKHLSADEVTGARMRIAAMAPSEIKEWKVRLMACSPKQAAVVLRDELAKAAASEAGSQ